MTETIIEKNKLLYFDFLVVHVQSANTEEAEFMTYCILQPATMGRSHFGSCPVIHHYIESWLYPQSILLTSLFTKVRELHWYQ